MKPPNKYLPLSIWMNRFDIIKNISTSIASKDKKIKESAESALQELGAYNLENPKCSVCDVKSNDWSYCDRCGPIYLKCSQHSMPHDSMVIHSCY